MSIRGNRSRSSSIIARKKKIVLMIDPFSSVRFLVHNLLSRGKNLVCLITSQREGHRDSGFSKSNFLEVLHYRNFGNDPYRLKKFLEEKYCIECLIPGIEETILTSDDIATKMEMTLRNKSDLTICRRDKYAMHMRLKACGLRHIRQSQCRTSAEVLRFARKIGFPCVCKPPLGTRTEGVHKCLNETDVVAAAESIFASSDIILCQEYIVGTEYVFDSVSYQGIHLPSMIYKYEKNSESQGFAYVNTFAIDFDNSPRSLPSRLYVYISAVLNALGIQNGPSHAEVFMTDTGPCLVEIGARMHGVIGPYVTEKISSLECSQHFLTADVFVNRGEILQKKFKDWIENGILPYEIRKSLIWHDLQVSQTMGTLLHDVETTAEPLLSSLQTTQQTYYFMFKNDKLLKTRDMPTSPGGVVLIGTSKQVKRDYEQVLAWERSGMLWEARKASSSSNFVKYNV